MSPDPNTTLKNRFLICGDDDDDDEQVRMIWFEKKKIQVGRLSLGWDISKIRNSWCVVAKSKVGMVERGK